MSYSSYGLILFICFSITKLNAQCPSVANFNLPSSSCLGQNTQIVDLSENLTSYEWDFYAGDLLSETISDAIDLGNPNNLLNEAAGITIVKENNNYFGFIVINNPIKLLRIDFGPTLNITQTPTIVDLGNPFNQLDNGLNQIRFFQNHGFFSKNNSIVHFVFNDGLNNPPSSFTEITNTSLEEFSTPGNLRIIEDQDSVFLIVCNSGNPRNLSILSFGSNINNTPQLVNKVFNMNTTNSVRFAVDIDFVKICGDWKSYHVTNNGQFVIQNFGNSLTNSPSQFLSNTVSLGGGTRYLKVVKDDNSVFLIVQTNNNRINNFNLGAQGNNVNPALIFYNNVSGGSNGRGMSLIKENSTWNIFVTNYNNNRIFKSTFNNLNYVNESVSSSPIVNELPYNSPGIKYISLKGIDSLGNVTSFLDTIEILNNIQPSYTFDGACIDNETNFSENIIFNGLTLENRFWSFGDGDTSSLESPSHQFSSTGIFPVQLTLTANNGCESNFLDSVFITDIRPENPAFEFSPNVICENTLINFINTTTTLVDSVVAVEWDFGDGVTSNTVNPSHTFSNAGNYEVVLKVTGKFGCDTTVSQLINVRPGPTPAFQFENLCIGDTVEFLDLSSSIPPSQIISWEWDFGDSSLISTTQNTNHFYQDVGNYEVILTVETDSGCLASSSQTIIIESLPNSNFSIPIVCAMTEANFESQTTSNISSWLWEVNDDTYIGNNASIFFPNQGHSDLTLTTTSASGCVSSTTQTIEVFSPLLPDFDIENLCFGDSVQFLDATPSFSNVEWLWNFGQPNAFSFEQNPKYAYNQPGIYNVTLNVQNAIGCESSIVQSVEIFETPIADIAHDTACLGQDFLVWDNTSTNLNDPITNLVWQQADSVFASSDSLLLNLDSEFVELTLSIETESGCKSETSKIININETPEIDFTFSPNYGTAPQAVEFENLSSGLVSYVWDFGDGTQQVFEENPQHVYQENGEYIIQLIGFNEVGCSDVLQKTIPIVPSELDIEVRSVALQKEVLADGNIKITPTVVLFNTGSRLIENADLYMQLDGQQNIVETWEGNLNIGNSINYTFNSFYVVSEIFDAQRVCVEAKNVNDNTETNIANNKACALVKGLFSISNPYPNPASQTLNLDIVTDARGEADMIIFDFSGKTLWQQKNTSLNAGFNKVTVNTATFMSGKYFFKIRYLNDEYLVPFVVID